MFHDIKTKVGPGGFTNRARGLFKLADSRNHPGGAAVLAAGIKSYIYKRKSRLTWYTWFLRARKSQHRRSLRLNFNGLCFTETLRNSFTKFLPSLWSKSNASSMYSRKRFRADLFYWSSLFRLLSSYMRGMCLLLMLVWYRQLPRCYYIRKRVRMKDTFW